MNNINNLNDYSLKFKGNLQIPDDYNKGFPTMNVNFPINKNQVNNEPISVLNEPHIVYTNHEEYISLSSSNRDSVNYPLHYDYRFKFDHPYKNVKKIELISAILPNKGASSSSGDILNEPSIVLDIDQLNFIEFPNNVGSRSIKAFSILPLKAATKSTGGFINPELGCMYNTSKVFKTPLASLDHFSIKLRSIKGELYDFGQPNGSTDEAFQNHFVFKITIEEAARKVLNQRNVF